MVRLRSSILGSFFIPTSRTCPKKPDGDPWGSWHCLRDGWEQADQEQLGSQEPVLDARWRGDDLNQTMSGWWFGTWLLWLSRNSWEWNNHPNWRTPSFFRGVGIPPTRCLWRIHSKISWVCVKYRRGHVFRQKPSPKHTCRHRPLAMMKTCEHFWHDRQVLLPFKFASAGRWTWRCA